MTDNIAQIERNEVSQEEMGVHGKNTGYYGTETAGMVWCCVDGEKSPPKAKC
jgi:hypothetical protein